MNTARSIRSTFSGQDDLPISRTCWSTAHLWSNGAARIAHGRENTSGDTVALLGPLRTRDGSCTERIIGAGTVHVASGSAR